MANKKVIIIAASAIAAVLLCTGIVFLVRGNGEKSRIRNILSLAGDYIAQDEYQRALALLEGILIEDPNNEAAKLLRDEALQKQRESRNAALAGAGDSAPAPDGSLDAAMQAIQAMQAQSLAAQERLALERSRMEADASVSRAEAEAERLAAAAAAAAAEEQRKQAQAEEMARASRETQEKMRAVNELVDRGRGALKSGDIPSAEAAFRDALEKMPAGESRFDAGIRSGIASAYYDLSAGRDTAQEVKNEARKYAGDYARSSVERDRAQAQPHYTLGKIAGDLRQWESARDEFKEAARLDGSNFAYFTELARAQFNTGNFAEAVRAYESAVQINPGSESAWYNLGAAYGRLGRQDNALSAYRKATEVKPDYAAAHRQTGYILSAKGDKAGAIEAYKRCLLYDPGNLAALRELGAAQNGSGDYSGAEASFSRALGLAPDDDQTNYNMALVKIELKKYGEARAFSEKAAAAAPSKALYHYTLGLACESDGDEDGAIAAYAKAASLDQKYVRPRINLGKIFIANNLPSQALTLLLEAYRAEPSSFEVNNNLGAAYQKLEDWGRSVDHYEKAITAEPNNATTRLNLARAHIGAANFNKARDQYRETLRLNPDNADAQFELGKAYVSLGDAVSAKQQLEVLLRTSPNYPGKAEAERILGGL
ncbi:MAG: tetratricopeptide repeat protein [Spirochaetaceae bacterium]|jgi:tetratricopeptide (TPR) repeat protein|nr:tetratricopeptide repeat protein [Spirochaetaceae bacterium]